MHYPSSDVSPLTEALDSLGMELKARLEEGGAAPGGRKALEALNHLLFGDPAPDGFDSGSHAARSIGSHAASGSVGRSSEQGGGGGLGSLSTRRCMHERCSLNSYGGSIPWNLDVVPPRGFGMGLRVSP